MPAAKNHARTKLGSPRVGIPGAKKRSGTRPDEGKSTTPAVDLPPTETLAEAKRQNEGLRGKLLAIELAVREGRLVDRAEQDRRDFALMRTVRDAIRAIPRRVAAEVHAAEDVPGVQRILARELDDALRTLCDRLDTLERAHAQ